MSGINFRNLFFALLVLLLVAATATYLYNRGLVIRESLQRELSTIADLKVSQVVNWHNEQGTDAVNSSQSPFLHNYLVRLFAGDKKVLPDIIKRFELLRDTSRFEALLIYDLKGNVRLAVPPAATADAVSQDLIRQVVADDKMVFTDIRQKKGSADKYLDIVAPIKEPGSDKSSIIGTMVFRLDPDVYLYPIIQAWPTTSRSGETLLFEREGDDVLYLNELRHRRGTALQLRMPITDGDLPAARALRGEVGMVEGKDYRGVQVIAAIRRVPGTPWYLIAKVDRKEIFSSANQQMAWSIGAIISLLALLTSAFLFVERRKIKDEFLGMVSHELRTPVAISREGVSQVLDGVRGEINDDQRKVLSSVIDNLDRLGRLVNDILDVFRIQAGKMSLKRKIFDLTKVAEEVALTFKEVAEKKGLDLRLDLPATRLNVCADRDKLFEVLTNLVGNAVKFTSDGFVEIAIYDREKKVECQVIDSGAGISQDEIPKLFTKFERLGRSEAKGTGLGLVIVKYLVEMHGGEIKVESKLGQGSTFTFIIPRK